jgi:hypothetical protein
MLKKMGSVQYVIEKFNAADGSIKATFPKVDPRLIVGLIFDRNANQKTSIPLTLF